MTATSADLRGAWRLVRWSFVHDDDRPNALPMGDGALGYILYTPGGEVSATIMRADKSECFAYAGRYEVRDGTVFHSIEISTDPALIGLRSARRIDLQGTRLTLSGPDFQPGTGRTQKIEWLRNEAK